MPGGTPALVALKLRRMRRASSIVAAILPAFTPGKSGLSTSTEKKSGNILLRIRDARRECGEHRKRVLPLAPLKRAGGGGALFFLIVSLLDGELLGDLLELGRQLKMEALVEVHSADEIGTALD